MSDKALVELDSEVDMPDSISWYIFLSERGVGEAYNILMFHETWQPARYHACTTFDWYAECG
jgi:hypothetical protein